MTHHNAQRGPWLKPGITERLTELHAASGMGAMSMSEIAAKLSFEFGAGITRNAVIGRSRRVGLSMRLSGKRPRPAPPRKRKKRPRKRLVIDPIALRQEASRDAVPTGKPLTIYQLNDRNCHWPLGELEARPPYLFCGKPAIREGCPWCAEHYAITHVVARERAAA